MYTINIMNYFDFLDNYIKTKQTTYGELISEKNTNQLAKNMMSDSEILEYNKNKNTIINRMNGIFTSMNNNSLNNNDTMNPNNIGTKKYISGINEVTQIM